MVTIRTIKFGNEAYLTDGNSCCPEALKSHGATGCLSEVDQLQLVGQQRSRSHSLAWKQPDIQKSRLISVASNHSDKISCSRSLSVCLSVDLSLSISLSLSTSFTFARFLNDAISPRLQIKTRRRLNKKPDDAQLVYGVSMSCQSSIHVWRRDSLGIVVWRAMCSLRGGCGFSQDADSVRISYFSFNVMSGFFQNSLFF